MRNVWLLYITEAAHYLTNDEKKKPYTCEIYGFTKGSIDLPDQRVGSSTFKQKKGNRHLSH